MTCIPQPLYQKLFVKLSNKLLLFNQCYNDTKDTSVTLLTKAHDKKEASAYFKNVHDDGSNLLLFMT